MLWLRDQDNIERGREEGRKIGREEGLRMAREESFSEGEDRMGQLVTILISKDRISDLQKAAVDKTLRAALYREFNID